MKKQITFLLLCSLLTGIKVSGQQILLSEDFESGTLNPLITTTSAGTFTANPGIDTCTRFGSTKAYGFGISTCAASCFGAYASSLVVTFPSPVLVDSIKVSEMELFNNWGSDGNIYLDNVLLPNSLLGTQPTNNHAPDATPRYAKFGVNQSVQKIEFRVSDITNSSEIYIDDLMITGLITGADGFSQTVRATLYPNPVADKLRITTGGNEPSQIIIYDIASRKLVEQSFTNSISLNLEQLAKGIYLYEVSDKNGILKKGKIDKM